MSLSLRLIKVTLAMPGGDVILDQSLNLRVKISKGALSIQNRATIEVINLSASLREQLLSQFTAYNQRKIVTGQVAPNYVNVSIEAGYGSAAANNLSVIFTGQVVICEPSSPPPNLGIKITCYSRQIDRTTFVTTPAPAQTTFYGYVLYAAQQMGFGSNLVFNSTHGSDPCTNPGRQIQIVSGLLLDIQNMYRPDVAAFVDDNILYVMDRDAVVNTANIAVITEFIGPPPCWTEWGVTFQCLFNPSIRLAQAAQLTSLINPSVNGVYVVMEIEYDLCSREGPFYVRASGNPPA